MAKIQKVRAHLFSGKSKRSLGAHYVTLGKFEEMFDWVAPDLADVLFVTHEPRSVRSMFSVQDRGQIRVFLGREAVSPDLNVFDYAVSFDQTLTGDRTFRPHTLLAFEHDLSFGDLNRGQDVDVEEFFARRGFCDFIYSNHRGHSMRQEIFHRLSSRFDGVGSYGSFLRNASSSKIELMTGSASSNWRADKIQIQSQHQFSICAENARLIGYTSEKLLTSLMAGSIPIYWGNPAVALEFNEKRFINFDGQDLDALVETVQQIRQSPQALQEKLREPAMTGKQVALLSSNRDAFDTWFSRFFTESPKALVQRPRGWFPDWYSAMVSSAYRRQRWSSARIRGAWRSLRFVTHG